MIEVGSDFSGVGAFDQALRRLKIKYKTVFSCDMDLYARETYMANYGEPAYYPFDVYDRKIPKKSLDIYMTSPPCQAFSLAGKRKGEDDKRGVLFYNSHEFIVKKKPRYFIFENVKGLKSDAKGRTFQIWLDMLGGKSVNGNPVIFPREDAAPYHIYHKVLNAKHYGVPQNRERVFIIGIRDDADNYFHWPKPFPLVKRLKDVLEDEVDEKYYLSERMIKWLQGYNDRDNGFSKSLNLKDENSTHANCLRANASITGTDNILKVGYIKQDTQASQVFDSVGDTPTLSAGTHGYAQGNVKVKAATKKGYEVATENDSINLSNLSSETRRGRVGKGVAQTLDTACNQAVFMGANIPVQKDNVVVYDIPQIVKVRKNEVNIIELQQELKQKKCYSNREISEKLNIEKTTVDHWFRTDNGFSIPDANIWLDLKRILKITTTKFDNSILQFEEREGVFEKGNRVYGINGIAPTMTSTSADERIINNHQIRRLTPREAFRLMDFPDTFIIDKVSNSQAYKQAGNSIVVGVLAEIIKRLKLFK